MSFFTNTSDLEQRISDPSIKVRIRYTHLFPDASPTTNEPGFCGVYIFKDIAVVVSGKTEEILKQKKHNLDEYFRTHIDDLQPAIEIKPSSGADRPSEF